MKKEKTKADPKEEYKIIDLSEHDPRTPTMLRENINCKRLHIKNGEGHVINIAPGVSITAEHTLITGNRLTIIGSEAPGEPQYKTQWKGGFRIAGSIEYLSLNSLDISHGEHGILASQHTDEEQYGLIEVNNCHIHHIEKEGIYLGKSDASSKAPRNGHASIKNSFIYLCGWDGIQIGRFTNTHIEKTEITQCGKARIPWQEKAITINPHCGRVDIIDCRVSGPQQYLQPQKIFVH